jgi:hypothetical protein
MTYRTILIMLLVANLAVVLAVGDFIATQSGELQARVFITQSQLDAVNFKLDVLKRWQLVVAAAKCRIERRDDYAHSY